MSDILGPTQYEAPKDTNHTTVNLSVGIGLFYTLYAALDSSLPCCPPSERTISRPFISLLPSRRYHPRLGTDPIFPDHLGAPVNAKWIPLAQNCGWFHGSVKARRILGRRAFKKASLKLEQRLYIEGFLSLTNKPWLLSPCEMNKLNKTCGVERH